MHLYIITSYEVLIFLNKETKGFMEKIILVNSVITLITKDQLKSITHDLLVQKGIVPEDFEVIREKTFYAFPISQISYTNGFSIRTEPNRTLFQILIPNFKEKRKKSLNLLKKISLKYVTLFKEILECKFIGINFDFIKDDLHFETFVKKSINLNSSFFNFEGKKSDIQKIDTSYVFKGKKFNITISKISKRDIKTNVEDFITLFKINVHYDLQYDDDIVTIINELKENYEKSLKFISEV